MKGIDRQQSPQPDSDETTPAGRAHTEESSSGNQWFHVHIPKTAGTSLNRMLAEALGNEFAGHHGLDLEAAPLVAASHISFLQARRRWPDRRIVTILREPVARLRSVMQHFYGRRHTPRYHRLGHIIAAMYQGSLDVDPHLLDHPLFREQCDNVMVRFLSSARTYHRITEAHLAEAIDNLENIDVLILNEQFTEGAERLFARLGRECPPPRRENTRIVEESLFEDLPDGLEPYVRLDRELIAAARERLAATE